MFSTLCRYESTARAGSWIGRRGCGAEIGAGFWGRGGGVFGRLASLQRCNSEYHG